MSDRVVLRLPAGRDWSVPIRPQGNDIRDAVTAAIMDQLQAGGEIFDMVLVVSTEEAQSMARSEEIAYFIKATARSASLLVVLPCGLPDRLYGVRVEVAVVSV